MRLVLVCLTAILLALAALPARAQPAASFDCRRAATAVEKFICADRGIAALDAALGRAFAARRGGLVGDAAEALIDGQRQWQGRRVSECRISTRNDLSAMKEIWTESACMAALYRDRLAELGEPQDPVAVDPAPEDGGFIHPLCLSLVIPSARRDEPPPLASLDLAACNRGFAHLSVDRKAEEVSAGPRDGSSGRFAYRPIGRAADGRELAITYEEDAAGSADQLIAIARRPDAKGHLAISAERLAVGGDGCSGDFITAARPAEGGLMIDYSVSPKTFVSHVWGITDGDAADCPQCCLGTIRIFRPNQGGTDVFVSASIARRAAELDPPASDADTCLDQSLARDAAQLPATLAPPALRSIGARFDACLKKTTSAAPEPPTAGLDSFH